jgi:hypothetical protein
MIVHHHSAVMLQGWNFVHLSNNTSHMLFLLISTKCHQFSISNITHQSMSENNLALSISFVADTNHLSV